MPIENSPQFHIYSAGLCYASVCTDLDAAAAEERMNRDMPTGIESQWKLSTESFKTGEPNGYPCPDKPTTHRHLLFSC